MNWSKKDIVNICKIVAFGIILYWLLQNIWILGNTFKVMCNVLTPFIAGTAIAFVVNIPMTILESREIKLIKKKGEKRKSIIIINNHGKDIKVSKTKRLLSIFISLIIIILTIIGIIFLVIPELGNVISNIINYIPGFLTNARDWIKHIIEEHPEVTGTLTNVQANLENFSSETIKELTSIGTGLVTSSFGVITSTISFMFNLGIAIIFSIYLLMGKEKIMLELTRMTYAYLRKDLADKVYKVATLSKQAFYNFVTGQFTECIILGTLCAIGMTIIQIPYSITIGAIVAITAFIPIVGAMIGGIIGIILILPVSFAKAVIFLIFFILLQQIENNVIYPKVVGSSVGIPGVLVLVTITIGGYIGGAVGMVICLPISSVLYTLVKESTSRRLKDKGYES